MQRMYSTPTVKTARDLYLITTPLYSLIMLMTAIEGATIFAYYVAKRCDILGAGIITNINEILPFTVLELFQHQPGLSGLFIASLSSAALSTLSSCLSSLSAVTYEDIIKVKFPGMSPHKATNISKIVVLFYGFVAMGLAFAISQIPGSVTSVFASCMGCMDGPVCAIFVLSAMFRRATTKGVLTGAVCGMILSFWLNVGSLLSGLASYPYLPSGPVDKCYIYEESAFTNASYLHSYASLEGNVTRMLVPLTTLIATNVDSGQASVLDKVYSISYILYSFIGFITSLVVGFVVSLLTTPPKKIDERCIFSFKRHLLGELCGHASVDEELNVTVDTDEVTKFMTRDEQM